jgi:RNA polymerase sigma-70 factor (ECF subfamily)
MSSDELTRIIQRAQRGDREAVATLYDRYVDVIYRYLIHRIPTKQDAEDLTAEVFLNMVKRLPDYRHTGAPFEAWLYRIAAALMADFYRKAGRRPETELTEWLSDYSPLPEEQLQRQQEIEAARVALQDLSEEQQTIVFLRFRERKSHEEVAQILGKSVDAIRSAQYRALSRLASLLGSEGKARHYLRGEDD